MLNPANGPQLINGALHLLPFNNPSNSLKDIIHPYLHNKKHLKNVGPIRFCEPPHAHSPDVASGTVARRLRIDVHDNDDNA